MQICLMTAWYRTPDLKRRYELDYCLNNNVDVFDHLVVFLEDELDDGIIREKWYVRRSVSVIPRTVPVRRRTYAEFFEHANETLRGSIVILANADICFTPAIRQLRERPEALSGTVFALSRWIPGGDGRLERLYENARVSQDSWIFVPPINLRTKPEFTLGQPGCDNRIACLFKEAGYTVLNPSLSIKSYHLHAGPMGMKARGRRPKVPGPYLHVSPTHLPWWKVEEGGMPCVSA